MLSFFQTYRNLILQTAVSLTLTLILTYFRIPILFLQALHTYIHPENVGHNNNNQHGIRAAIRRPSSSGSETTPDLKRRHKSKEKFEFDENNAQIFRLKLDEGHLQSRLYFSEYRYCFIYSFVGVSCFLLYRFLGVVDDDDDSGVLASGSLIPVILAFVGLCKVVISLVKVSFEKSASKRSEKQLSVLFGVLGFVSGLIICFGVASSVFDFDFGSVDGIVRVFVAVFMGCIVGLLYMPAGKCARSFWIGTDQLRCNLGIISCGWFARMILYANYLLIVFTALLWINPLAEFLVNKHNDDTNGGKAMSSSVVGDTEKLVGNVGLSQADFSKLRLWCLLLSGVTQIVALRPNLQMYLNEAVLSWYQRLHASKVPDLDFSRAKVFLHNHYLCFAALQFFAPPILVLLFLGLSHIDGNSVENFLVPCPAFFQELALFMAWWVVFVLAVFTSASLVLYRRGILYVS